MRTRLMIATAASAALLAGAAFAQSSGASGSNFQQNAPAADTSVNPGNGQALPEGVATGNAATNPTTTGHAGSGDPTAPNLNGGTSLDGASASTGGSAGVSGSVASGSTGADSGSVAPAAGAPTERASSASLSGSDVVTNGPIPDTRANRAKYGQPMSRAGKMTRAAGN